MQIKFSGAVSFVLNVKRYEKLSTTMRSAAALSFDFIFTGIIHWQPREILNDLLTDSFINLNTKSDLIESWPALTAYSFPGHYENNDTENEMPRFYWV